MGLFGLVSERRLDMEIALRRMFGNDARSALDRATDERIARGKAEAAVATLEDRVTSLQAELLAVQSQDALPGGRRTA